MPSAHRSEHADVTRASLHAVLALDQGRRPVVRVLRLPLLPADLSANDDQLCDER